MTPEEYKKQKLDEYFNERERSAKVDVEYCQVSENTVGEVIHMPVEEYMRMNNCHTYEEIKKRLGLE